MAEHKELKDVPTFDLYADTVLIKITVIAHSYSSYKVSFFILWYMSRVIDDSVLHVR